MPLAHLLPLMAVATGLWLALQVMMAAMMTKPMPVRCIYLMLLIALAAIELRGKLLPIYPLTPLLLMPIKLLIY